MTVASTIRKVYNLLYRIYCLSDRQSQNRIIFKEGESERGDEQFAFNDLGPRLDARAANDLRLANSKQMSTKFTAKTRYPLAPSWIRRRRVENSIIDRANLLND